MIHARTDVVVIGGGPGGLTVAINLRKRNPATSVTLIEKADLGGKSLSSGSIPSKVLLHLAKKYHTNPSRHKPEKVLAEVMAKVDEMRSDYDELELQKLGIDVLKGEPVFVGRRCLSINDTLVKFKRAVIATGSSPKMLSLKGLDHASVLSVDDVFALKKLPKHLLIVGTGRTGIEIGQALAMLGSKVTIVNEHELLLPYLNKEIRHLLSDEMRGLGVRILHDSQVLSIKDNTARIQHGGAVITSSFDHVMFAVGRDPIYPEGLKKAHVRTKLTGIPTNLKHQTRNHRIFAIGDVASVSHFTHIAVDQGYDVVQYILDWRSRHKHRPAPLVPATLYAAPEIATVGLSMKEAMQARRKRSLRKIVVPYWLNDRAKTEYATDGVLTVVVHKRTSQIIGAQVAGNSAVELIAMFCLAMERNISLLELGSTLLPYPTYHELIQQASRKFQEET